MNNRQVHKRNKIMPLQSSYKKAALIFLIFIVTCGSIFLCQTSLAYAATSPKATVVYGQAGNFTTNTTNNGGVTTTSLSTPQGDLLDSNNNSYSIDSGNNRVLYYSTGSITATQVYGQKGSFSTSLSNSGGISANSLNNPQGLVLDSSGNLYISDSGNNRVLYYPAGSTTATRVYGQAGNFSTNLINNGGISASSLASPQGLVLDSSGNLYISDSANNRVLYYPSGSTTATRVYGQVGSFNTISANSSGINTNSLSVPQGLVLDSSSNLYISDSGNNRVLYYPVGSTTATRVYGQAGSFGTILPNSGGISASSLALPQGLALDSGGNLYVADNGNNRVLYYPASQTTATRVYGQSGGFTTGSINNGGITASSLNNPIGISVNSSGNIFVADTNNNRLVMFQTSLTMTVQPPVSSAAGATFGVAASLIDVGSGIIFTDFTGMVTAAIKTGSGTAGATLSGNNVVAAVAGVVTFTNLSIDKGGPNYYLTLSTAGSGSVTTIAFTIVGSLLLTYLTGPTFSVTLTGTNTPVVSQHSFKVNDNTGSGKGWHTTITSTQFVTAGGITLPPTVLAITGVTATCTAGQSCVLPSNGVNAYPITVPAATTAPAASTFFSANAGTGTGDITLTVTFALTVPAGSLPGTYTSTASEALFALNSYYTIVNHNSGKVVDVYGGSTSNGATIIQYFYHTGTNQQFQFVDVGGGYTKIVSRNSGKVIDVNGGSTASGVNMLQETDAGTFSQEWQFINIGGGYSKIINRNSGLALDVTGASLLDLALLIQTPYTGALSQQWQFGPSSS